MYLYEAEKIENRPNIFEGMVKVKLKDDKFITGGQQSYFSLVS